MKTTQWQAILEGMLDISNSTKKILPSFVRVSRMDHTKTANPINTPCIH